LSQRLPRHGLDAVEALEDAQGISQPPADIERTAAQPMYVRTCELEGVHDIVDEQDIPHLSTVAVYRDRIIRDRRAHEVRNPALILVTVLIRAINAAHAHDGGRQPIELGRAPCRETVEV